MKKYITPLILVSLLMIGLFSSCVFASETLNPALSIDGKKVDFQAESMPEPYVTELQRTMVPIRVISEKLGYKVEYQGQGKVVISKGDRTMEVYIGKSTAKINGQLTAIDVREVNGVKVPVDTKAVIINQRTFVPLRFIAENFGCTINVKTLNGVMVIDIVTGGTVPPVVQPPVSEYGVPVLTETATDNREQNIAVLKKLPFDDVDSKWYVGYTIFGETALAVSSDPYYKDIDARIVAYAWYWEGYTPIQVADKYKKLNAIAKETLRFYLPTDYLKAYTILDNINKNKGSSQTVTLDGRTVKIITMEGSVEVEIGMKK